MAKKLIFFATGNVENPINNAMEFSLQASNREKIFLILFTNSSSTKKGPKSSTSVF